MSVFCLVLKEEKRFLKLRFPTSRLLVSLRETLNVLLGVPCYPLTKIQTIEAIRPTYNLAPPLRYGFCLMLGSTCFQLALSRHLTFIALCNRPPLRENLKGYPLRPKTSPRTG